MKTDDKLTPAKEETLEEAVARLTAERDAATELAITSSAKLKKLEGVQADATVDVGEETYKILLKKAGHVTVGSSTAKQLQLVKNEDGTVDEGYSYPTETEFEELSNEPLILKKL